MSQPPKPRGLGRGLSALLGDEDVAAAIAPAPAPPPPAPAASLAASAEAPRPAAPSRTPFTLPIGQLRPGTFQPRTTFENIDALVDSVREYGLLQPILVRPFANNPDAYEIVAGERRWRAAQKAQLHDVPVVIRNFRHVEALQIALVENLQRVDLSAIDEAVGYRRLLDEFQQTQEEVAKTMGKSRPHVANMLRLLDLPVSVQDMVRHQLLSAGQARALLAFADPSVMATRAADEKLTVRDLEQMAKAPAGTAAPPAKGKKGGPPVAALGTKTGDTKALEKRIEEALGLKANLMLRGQGEQTLLTLEILDYDQLDNVVERLTRR